MSLSSKVRVAVLRGGPSSEYDVSLKSGHEVLSHLREMSDKYDPIDIFISKDGEWHRFGIVEEPHHALRHVDVVWNGLHGAYGEDGQVQRLLESMNIPYTGSSAMASAVSQDKHLAKSIYRQHDFFTPMHELLTREDAHTDRLITIFRTYLHPVVVKPANMGSMFGIQIAHTFPELRHAVEHCLSYSARVLVEEFVRGADVSCAVLEKAKGEDLYAFLPHTRKRLTPSTNRRIEDLARRAHRALGLRHYSNSDFIVTPKEKIYILETNSLPKFGDGSVVRHSLNTTGWQSRDFVDHVITLAR